MDLVILKASSSVHAMCRVLREPLKLGQKIPFLLHMDRLRSEEV
jgi:hypothetical protein